MCDPTPWYVAYKSLFDLGLGILGIGIAVGAAILAGLQWAINRQRLLIEKREVRLEVYSRFSDIVQQVIDALNQSHHDLERQSFWLRARRLEQDARFLFSNDIRVILHTLTDDLNMISTLWATNEYAKAQAYISKLDDMRTESMDKFARYLQLPP